MKKVLLSLAVMLMGLGVMAQTNTYTRITSETALNAGDKVLLVGFNDDGQAFVMSYQKTNNRHAIEITDNGGSITTSVANDASSQTEPFELTVGGNSGAWTFFDELNNGYLYAPGGGNYLKTQSNLDNKGQWTITFEGDGCVPTSNGGVEQNIMRYNVTSTLFGCYKSSSNVTGLVYIYKAGGEPTIDPEPSNYPTNFNASLDITKATLTWTASTGSQLPRGYLVIGSTGTITVPTDGTPVDNDTDASDGNVAYSTNGTTVSFEQLPANSTFTFAIFPYTNSGENIDYKTDGTYPTASVTTQNVTCIFTSDFANGLSPFTAYDVEGDQSWTTGSYDGIHFAKMSGYANSTNNANEDWLIFPDIFAINDVSEGFTVSFMNAYNYDGDPLKVYISEDYDGISDPNEFSWTDITNNFEWSAGNYAWVTTNHTFNTEGMSHFYFAFKYTSTTEASSTWEIAEFKIYIGYDAVAEYDAVSFDVYPNPAESSIKVKAEKATTIQVLDMTGRIVMSVNANEGENTISVAELQSGVYFVRMDGAAVKFVKR